MKTIKILSVLIFVLLSFMGCKQATNSSSSSDSAITIPGAGTLLAVDSSKHLKQAYTYTTTSSNGSYTVYTYNSDGTFAYYVYDSYADYTSNVNSYYNGEKGTYTYDTSTSIISQTFTSSYNETSAAWESEMETRTYTGYLATTGQGSMFLKTNAGWALTGTNTEYDSDLTTIIYTDKYVETMTITSGTGGYTESFVSTETDTNPNFVSYKFDLTGDVTVTSANTSLASGQTVSYSVTNNTGTDTSYESDGTINFTDSVSAENFTCSYTNFNDKYLAESNYVESTKALLSKSLYIHNHKK